MDTFILKAYDLCNIGRTNEVKLYYSYLSFGKVDSISMTVYNVRAFNFN